LGVLLKDRQPAWSISDNRRAIEIAVLGPFIANGFPTMLGATVEIVGLAQVPAPLATGAVTSGKLVRVLDKFESITPNHAEAVSFHRSREDPLGAWPTKAELASTIGE
jgi:hypothetical protein